MRAPIETERLWLRELIPADASGMFELDSNPEVHRYLHNNPLTDISQSREVIAMIRQQYIDNGIGRFAVVLKETYEFVGWAGLKLEKNVNGHDQFYDLGYRLIQKHWGKGYATEAAKAFIDFGFNEMKIDTICACALAANTASVNVFRKCGLQYINDFIVDGEAAVWYEIKNPNQ